MATKNIYFSKIPFRVNITEIFFHFLFRPEYINYSMNNKNKT